MNDIILENKYTGTKITIRVFKDEISFFVLSRKYSKEWITVGTINKKELDG
jgi:hypothetical protein